MNRRLNLACVGLAFVAASVAFAQPAKDNKAPAKAPAAVQPGKDAPKMDLPPGMTEADMKACMEAATPGEKHQQLAKDVGTWSGKATMWATAGAEPTKSDCTSTVTPIMDGRFIKCEMAGNFEGMGPFNGFGLYGFDNVSQKFQCTWIDNCTTGMMTGTGEASSDGKTMTWTYTGNCPLTKKPIALREEQRWTGKDTKTLTMYGPDLKTGKEFKMMEINLTRKSGGPISSAK